MRNVRQASPNATVHATYAIFNNRSERQPFEQGVKSSPHRIPCGLAKALDALHAETKEGVNIRLFVVTTKQMHLIRVLNLKCQ